MEDIFQQGVALHQQGQMRTAEILYRQILGQTPNHLDAMHFLGVLQYQTGRFDAAVELLRQAVNLAPEAAGLHCNLGLALQQMTRLDEALACQDRALALKPNFVEALNNRGNVLRELNRLEEAATSFERALQLRPEFAEAHYNLGGTLLDLQQPKQALEYLTRCLSLTPNKHQALGLCGIALMTLRQPQEALNYFNRALQFTPNDAEAHYWQGNAMLELGRPEQAVASYRQALQHRPDIAEVHYNLANVLLDLQRHEEALLAYSRALEIRPGYVEAWYNLGGMRQELGHYEEAAASYERVMALAPGHRYTVGKLFHSRQLCCDWSRHAEQVTEIIHSLVGNSSGDMPFSFLAVSPNPALQLRCARAYTAAKYPASPAPLWNGERYRHDRLRIAYVSADFRDHAVAYLLAGVFETHDRQRFETIAISLRPRDESAMGQRVVAAFERFIDASSMRDTEVAALMRELEVDIAVDLTGYTQDNRTDIFALRPAPIQVNYLGFPGSMGAAYMDYILADEFVIPETARPHYAEGVAYLPHCFQGNDDQREIAARTPSRAEAGLPESGFVFCAFNNVYKLNPPMFDIWMRLLRAVPDSVLWLAADAPGVRKNLTAEAIRRGVAPERLVFSPRIPYHEHLARMRLADLFLDTLPFNAGTTASDALWAGLPVLTCTGEAFAARMAGSLLNAVGLPELITHDLDEYEALAIRLAMSPKLHADIRARLAANRDTRPWFDTKLFCRCLESAYTGMWERLQRGEPPAGFSVADSCSRD